MPSTPTTLVVYCKGYRTDWEISTDDPEKFCAEVLVKGIWCPEKTHWFPPSSVYFIKKKGS